MAQRPGLPRGRPQSRGMPKRSAPCRWSLSPVTERLDNEHPKTTQGEGIDVAMIGPLLAENVKPRQPHHAQLSSRGDRNT